MPLRERAARRDGVTRVGRDVVGGTPGVCISTKNIPMPILLRRANPSTKTILKLGIVASL